jgi:DNA invertase Pin-like site-specific DNA recombinase
MSTTQLLRAAQYLRMSTEHQRYSLGNQAAVIARYAAERGYELNRTYFDPGRSGLTLRERKGLQALLSEALRPDRQFDAILVLDVSRWGRFQDADQSAHYEYLCREAGVQVVYCAEPFENDGGPVSTLVKQIKRLMAAEYSRELSDKITRARLQQAGLGFYQGGTRMYGVRRMAVDATGEPRTLLRPGERKGVASDRVVLVPGPPEEASVVRRIFRRFVRDGRGLATIAAELNRSGLTAAHDQPWNPHLVRAVLTNELMVGNYTFNRTVRRLKGRGQANPPEAWVRVKVMAPIVSAAVFKLAQERLNTRRRERWQKSRVVRGLERLMREEGRISRSLIDRCSYLPSAMTVRRMFGGVGEAYELVGYQQTSLRWSIDNRAPAGNEEILRLLRHAFERRGHLSAKIIEEDRDLPSCRVICMRFGSLRQAYELAGLPHRPSDLQRRAYQRSVERGTAAVLTGALHGRRHLGPPMTDAEMISGLQAVFARAGYVSASLINAEAGLVSPTSYIRRFGSLHRAYQLAGLPSDKRELRPAAQKRGWRARKQKASVRTNLNEAGEPPHRAC